MAAFPNDQNVAFSCMCFDEYSTEGQTNCVNGCISMTAYMVHVDVVARPPCSSRSTGVIRIPGERNGATADLFSTEKGKQFVHSLFAAAYSVVKERKFFSKITAANVFVSPEGNARFHNVQVLGTGTPVHRANKARQNYHQVCQIAIDCFTQASKKWGGGQIPCDIAYLFNQVMQDKGLRSIEFYHISFSLVPIAVGMMAYTKMFDNITPAMDPTLREALFNKLAACQEFQMEADLITLHWVKEVRENSLLRSIYNHENSVNYIITDELIKKKTGVPVGQVRQLRQTNSWEYNLLRKRTEVAVFLDFLRHRTAHRMQSWFRNSREFEYSPEESDYACLAKFRLFLVKLQWELWVLPGFDFSKLNFPGLFGF